MQVKGTAVLTLPLFIREKFGEDSFEKWLSHLSAEAEDIFRFPVLPSNWYPVKEILIEPTKTICDLFYNGNTKGAWESGRFSADYGLKGIYKVFVKIGSVQFLIKKATSILPAYYDSCRIEVVDFKENETILHITDFREGDVIIDYRIGGWVERALEISGCKGVNVKITKSLAKGDPVTEYRVAWN